jgi:hypothetical protein
MATISKPSAAKDKVIALPIPRLAPVMTATGLLFILIDLGQVNQLTGLKIII